MRYRFPIRLLLFIAFAVSLYLAFVTFGGAAVAGCGPNSGCDRVLQSHWSKWFGIPVSAFSLVVYGALFTASLQFKRKPDPVRERAVWRIILPLSILAVLSVLYFVSLQLAVLKQVCPFCMTVHGAGLLASILLLIQAPIREAPEKPWQAEKQVFLRPKLALTLSLIAVAAFGLFAGGQAIYKPKTYSFQTYDGRFQFDLNDVPLIGDPNKTNAVVSLFDYTCHHCRTMHWHLMEAFPKLSNQISIINLPNPLDGRCNSNVDNARMRKPNPHELACDYARLGLAVWRVNRKVHHEFDDWLFKPEQPPTVAAAQQYAAKLVGSNELVRAIQDPWVEKTLQLGIRVYSTNYIHFKMGNMPQLIVGTNIILSTFRDTGELFQVFEKNLGIKPSN